MKIHNNTAGRFSTGAQNLTTQPLTIGAVQVVGPEFVGYAEARLMFGLSRTHLYKLGIEGSVKTVSLRGRGTTRGRRLYSVESIRAFINASMEEHTGAEEGNN
jgi:hypothetical protein